MIGAFLGFLTCFVLSLTEVTSWWWLLWGTLLGFLFEICARYGCGEELGDAIGSAIDLSNTISSDSGGDYGSSDCGSCDSGGGGGD